MKRVFLYAAWLILPACQQPSQNPIASLLNDKQAAVFVFLAPDCPLSQNYTLTLNNLHKDFAAKGIGFYGVFSGEASTETAVNEFLHTYPLSFPTLLDERSKLADFFAATKTPEVFLVASGGRTLYKGAIDNWSPELGQHRTVITEHYLLDALDSLYQNKRVPVKETPAVGCFIERRSVQGR